MKFHRSLALFAAIVMLAGCVSDGGPVGTADVTPKPPKLDPRVVDLEAGGTTTRLLIEAPANPKATVVLLTGGHGRIDIEDDGTLGRRKGSFPLSHRQMLLERGLATAVVARPKGMERDTAFRSTAQYAAIMGAVIRHLRDKFGAPVWLHGHSRGAIGAAAPASRLAGTPDAPDGIIPSASMTVSIRELDTIFDVDLGKVTVPVLVMHHKEDACVATPPGDVDKLAKAFTGSPDVQVRWYTGGSPRGHVCFPNHYHGYRGIEEQVIRDIAGHIGAGK